MQPFINKPLALNPQQVVLLVFLLILLLLFGTMFGGLGI